jgi:hypothetical protein
MIQRPRWCRQSLIIETSKNWEPLSEIANACKSDRPETARRAAGRLSAIDDDETASIKLLEDLKTLLALEQRLRTYSGAAELSMLC